MNELTWLGIIFCLSQSAMFSGLNLALFSISRLKLEVESKQGNQYAIKILDLRKDSNYLLTTILWGNVSVNVILALLSKSVMTGLVSFFFSTFVITLFGEILPQAYFSRHALKIGYSLLPVLKIYQVILFPFAKPTSIMLDKLVGKEAIQVFKEEGIEELIKIHIGSKESDVGTVEGKGALNFLAIDDLKMSTEGAVLDNKSIIELPFKKGLPVFPEINLSTQDDFFDEIYAAQKKWVVIVDHKNTPRFVLNTDRLLRSMVLNKEDANLMDYCHKPILIENREAKLGDFIPQLEVQAEDTHDNIVDEDVILLWSGEKRIITGADILGRLLRGIVKRKYDL